MLSEGARDWNADTIAERMENVGATLSASADRDLTAVGMRSLTQEPALGTAVETLAGVLAAPSFPPVDLERARENTLIALRQAEEDPGKVGQKALFRQVFGTHPYASDPAGTQASVRALTRADLQGFHQRYYTGANAVVAIVGALDRPAAEALAERVVGGLPAGSRAPALPPVADLTQAAVETIRLSLQPDPRPGWPAGDGPRRPGLFRALSGQPHPGGERAGLAPDAGGPGEARPVLQHLQLCSCRWPSRAPS